MRDTNGETVYRPHSRDEDRSGSTLSDLQSDDRIREGRSDSTGPSELLSNRTTIKPEPPSDLWEQLDRIVAVTNERPPNSFTAVEFANRYKMARRTAQERIRNMVESSQITDLGRIGRFHYYRLPERRWIPGETK